MLLQKKDNEGFGFVLRGAKGEPQSPHILCVCARVWTCFSLFLTYLLPHCPHSHTLPAAQTPIEEFTPTPAFPALQYLESVDEGGVAWRAGLRMGDFLIEVKILFSFYGDHRFGANVQQHEPSSRVPIG